MPTILRGGTYIIYPRTMYTGQQHFLTSRPLIAKHIGKMHRSVKLSTTWVYPTKIHGSGVSEAKRGYAVRLAEFI
ncbi:predicted protein [Botrytis cinerea T4]|uniref:Uncharacterized protein n=1 Tax=Botryotinia fuckeliana (strain T4) TaxID=999810 RepID=G2XQW4_BOTF4|nr:predicted protein [Botrytis cinerea T4]